MSEYSAERVERLVASWEPRLARAFLLATAELTPEELEDVERLLNSGLISEALAIVEARIAVLADRATDALVAAAKDAASFLSGARKLTVTFDQTNERAVAQMRANRLRMIREFADDQRDAIRAVLTDGVRRGLNPKEQARAFSRSIGLTRRQVEAVQNYRRLLETGSRAALDRALRDRRFDGLVSRSIREGEPLTAAQVDRMVAAYERRYKRYRATVVARTESLRAVHLGVEEMFRQGVDEGLYEADELVRRWVTAKDERVRGSHRSMSGQTRTLAQLDAGELFVSGSGVLLRHPGDPNAPASETAQCRCVLATVFKEDLEE